MFEIDKEKFGEFVAQLRKEKGMMQKELAEKLYVSDKAVSKWERGLSIPDAALLIPLAELLGVTVTELLKGERLSQDQPMDTTQSEDLLRKVINLTEEKRHRYPAGRVQRGLMLALCAAVGILEILILLRLGLDPAELSASLFTIMGLMAGFGLYYCCFATERLPEYYDSHRISMISDGFVRMNLPGVYFNNRNWPYILKVGQLWAMIGLATSPLLYFVLRVIFSEVWHIAGVALTLLLTLGGMFIPLIIVGRKYEFAPETERPQMIRKRDLRILLVILLLLAIPAAGGFMTYGSGLQIGWTEEKTASTWCADYYYYNGFRQRTVNIGGETAVLEAEIVTMDGSVDLKVTDSHGTVIFEQEDIPSSVLQIEIPPNSVVTINAQKHRGSFSLRW